MRTLAASILALAAALAPACSQAQRVDVRLEDRTTGTLISQHAHGGRSYAVGEAGHRYAIRLVNRSGERVLAVVSVDGVNVVTGETANPAQSGYVLEAWGSVLIDGWRKSLSEVAAFHFTELPDSYAARTGRPDNVGVIGVAVFRERRVPLWQEPPAIAREAPAAPSADAMGSARREQGLNEAEKSRLGTGHGERAWSHARTTRFERASSQPSQVSTIWYDSRRNLVAMGVIPPPHRQRWYADLRDSRPFPGFVPDPW
jgi:hypothetical protein